GAKSHACERRGDFAVEILVQMRPARRHLALGANGDAPAQIVDQPALVVIGGRLRDRCFTRHGLLPGFGTPPARCARKKGRGIAPASSCVEIRLPVLASAGPWARGTDGEVIEGYAAKHRTRCN